MYGFNSNLMESFMKGISYFLLLLAGIFAGCGNSASEKTGSDTLDHNRIIQHENGTLLLSIDDADCYSDEANPVANTAEWNALIVKSGRYDIWLASATRDTISLNYRNSVHLNFKDINIDANPRCDDIILDTDNLPDSYFMANSYIGTVYIQDTGAIDVQFISEQILPKSEQGYVDSRFVSLCFKPEARK